MKLKELKSLTVTELRAKEKDFRDELFKLRMRQTTGQLEKPSRLRELKIDIARILTLTKQAQKKAA